VPLPTRKYGSIWFWQSNYHNSVNSSQIGLRFLMHKNEYITGVLAISKWLNLFFDFKIRIFGLFKAFLHVQQL
jgi:hypothetical protein